MPTYQSIVLPCTHLLYFLYLHICLFQQKAIPLHPETEEKEERYCYNKR